MIIMNNLENLATEIGKDIKDIRTRFATKEEMHEATEIDYSQVVTHEELEGKHYLTAHQSLADYAKKSEIVTPQLTLTGNTLGIVGGNRVTLPIQQSAYTTLSGLGTPEGKTVANPGDTYINKNVSLGDYYYYKERNPGKNTGWKVLYGSMGVNINLLTGNRIRFARENYFVSASISDLTISLDSLKNGQARDFYQEGENVVIRFIPTKQFDARESIIPQGFRPSGNFLVPAYSKSGDSIGLFKFEQTFGIVKLILNDINKDSITSEMLKGINSGLIVYPTQETWPTKLP